MRAGLVQLNVGDDPAVNLPVTVDLVRRAVAGEKAAPIAIRQGNIQQNQIISGRRQVIIGIGQTDRMICGMPL